MTGYFHIIYSKYAKSQKIVVVGTQLFQKKLSLFADVLIVTRGCPISHINDKLIIVLCIFKTYKKYLFYPSYPRDYNTRLILKKICLYGKKLTIQPLFMSKKCAITHSPILSLRAQRFENIAQTLASSSSPCQVSLKIYIFFLLLNLLYSKKCFIQPTSD